jgi:microcompartment protein CcmL/EutN
LSDSSATSPLPGPALALLELDSIARGYVVADAVVKRAAVTLALAEAVTPGKYLLLFSGGVAEVQESFQAGVETAGRTLLDKLLLPMAAEGLVAGLMGRFPGQYGESVGIVETHTVAATLLCADVALKRADVVLERLQLARGIGGKGVFVLAGELHMVEAALEGAAAAVEPHLLLTTELIQRPSPELRGRVL